MKKLPDIEVLRSLFSYSRGTGVLTRVSVAGPNTKSGDKAGTPNKRGTLRVMIFGSLYPVHRVVWAVCTGKDPYPFEIDHRNGVTSDNRRRNLRIATRVGNTQNRGLSRNNTSGYTGVSLDRRSGKYVASIGSGGKQIRLGSFETPRKAHAAYLEAKARLHLFQPKPRRQSH